MGWTDIESAPRDGTVFFALNHDREIYPAKFIDGRVVFRMNGRYEPRKFEVRNVDGERLLLEDEQYAKDNEAWQSQWVYWARLYEIKPTHWLPLPKPPATRKDESAAIAQTQDDRHND